MPGKSRNRKIGYRELPLRILLIGASVAFRTGLLAEVESARDSPRPLHLLDTFSIASTSIEIGHGGVRKEDWDFFRTLAEARRTT
jgi:hypothetical protein